MEHIKTCRESDEGLNNLQKSCPVCSKKFLLKKNLMTHMKRFHETEGSPNDRFQCQYCPKSFLYKAEVQAHENTHTGNP